MTVWLDKVKTCVGWDTVDQERVSKLHACLGSDLHEVVEALGSCVVQFKDTQSLMANARFVQRLHGVLREWLAGPLAGEFDEAYAQTRWRLVRKLMEVDLTFEDIILMEGLAREQLLKLAQACLDVGTEDLSATIHTLDKALRLDMALIYGGYTQVRDAEIERATLDRFLAITGFSRSLYENLAEAREWSEVSMQQSDVR
jgi:hypothetical protein